MTEEYIRIISKTGLNSKLLATHLGRCSIEEWEAQLDNNFEGSKEFKAIESLELYYDSLYEDLTNKINSGIHKIIYCTNIEEFSETTNLPPVMFFVTQKTMNDIAIEHPESHIQFIDDSVDKKIQ